MLDTSPTDELPPPSYEVSQEVFDQKTRQGIQASLEPQPEDDLWEVWDEAKFESNAGAFIDGSASSSSSVPTLPPTTAQRYPKEKAPRLPSPPQHQQEESAVRPLRIVKKSQTAAYNKAVEARSYQSNLMPSGPTSSSDDRASSLSRSLSVFTLGRRTPPPMFEPVGPSLDGPDYAEVMSYVPGHSRPSSPMSTLSSDSHRPPILPPPRMTDSRPNMVMPPPPPPRIQHQPAPRPMPAQAQRPLYQRPARRIGFDPMSAYKSKSPFTPGLEPTPERIDPASFYKWVSSIPLCAPYSMSYQSVRRSLPTSRPFPNVRQSIQRIGPAGFINSEYRLSHGPASYLDD